MIPILLASYGLTGFLCSKSSEIDLISAVSSTVKISILTKARVVELDEIEYSCVVTKTGNKNLNNFFFFFFFFFFTKSPRKTVPIMDRKSFYD